LPPRKKAQPKLTEEQARNSILGTPGVQPRPVEHLSYSGLNTHQECPKRYELSYVMGAPRKGAVWFVGGSAVHRATEAWDRLTLEGREPNLPLIWKTAFNEVLEEARAKDPDVPSWRKAGVRKDTPQGEDLTHWYSVLGPQLIQAYTAWRQRSAWKIWVTPDGEPAIELDVCGSLPGMGAVEFKGYIDRIFYDEHLDTLTVVDLKTGTRKPETGLQLGIYRAAIAHRYGVEINQGAAFMNRRGMLADVWTLDRYTPEYVGRDFARLYAAIQAGYFNATLGRHCGLCDVSASCYANNGPLAATYDRDHPERSTPF
jgi:putative RecB family exonuclease